MSLTAIDITIDHLPSDILLEIFLICQAIFQRPSDRRPNYRWDHNYRWIRVTHVCRRWRKLALEFPALWPIYIPAAQPDWVDELIRRSQTTPLSMLSMNLSNRVVRGEAADFSSLIRFLGPNSPISSTKRLRICLSFTSSLWKEIGISDFSPSVLNDLEELSFFNFSEAETTRPLIQFFTRHMPPLRSLSLLGCPWDVSIFQDSLTNLMISLSDKGVMWGEFCSVLARLKNLEHLDVAHVFRYLTRPPANDIKGYSFDYPGLRTLTLRDDRLDEYAEFLPQVSFPHTTYLDIDAGAYKDKDNLPSLLDIFSQHLLNLLPADHSWSLSLDLVIRLGSEQYLAFKLYTTQSLSCNLLSFRCSLHCNIGARTEQGITKMLASTNPNLLQHINLHTERFNIPVPLARAIARLPALRTLSIRDFGRSQALSPFQPIDILSCDCGLPSHRADADQTGAKGELCQACAPSASTCFPSLRVLEYRGSRTRKLDEKEFRLLRRILFLCDIAEHKIEELKLTSWGMRKDYSAVSIQELGLSCGKLEWNDYF